LKGRAKLERRHAAFFVRAPPPARDIFAAPSDVDDNLVTNIVSRRKPSNRLNLGEFLIPEPRT
jgi:hypothetical protein